MSDAVRWKCRSRNWTREHRQLICDATSVLAHPLTPRRNVVKVSKEIKETVRAQTPAKSNTNDSFVDPLGATVDNFEDPVLGRPTQNGCSSRKNSVLENTLEQTEQENMTDLDLELPFFKPWKEKRQVILDHFKTNEKLSLSTSFLLNGMENDFQGPMKNKTTQRRDPLNDSGGPRKVPDLTMDDYIRRLNDLKKLLLYAWANDCRVEALKIVIELTKILSTTLTPHFYPSQFVLVTDIVDLFGSLVYERLHRKATEERMNAGLGPLPKYFTLADVPDLTRQTASNWFYKISEILELIPRLYVEAGLLCCMKFMDNASISTNVMRLCVMARSISHPLVSSYARAYICRISMRLNPADRAPHWKCLNDWMQTYNQQPTALLWPAMEWVIQCVSYNAVTYEDLCPLWEYCRIPTKRAMILEPILNGVSPVYLATHALEACKIVTGCDEVSASELCAFGRSILQAEVSTESKRPILRSVWRRMSKLSSLRSYVLCCDVWIEFAARFFSLHELSVILDNLIKKIVPDKKYENFYENLLSILYKLVQYVIDIDELLLLDHFATLLELFREDELKSKSATLVLNSIVNKHKTRSITDFALANQVVWIAKRLHDAMDLNSAISQDGPAPEAILIEAAFDRFDLSADPERGLSVLVDARGALYNLNTIIRYLVVRVNDLALPSRNSSRLSARGRASFTRACLAYGFITIASLSDSSDKVRLYIQSIQVALSANALSQTDAIVRECIELLAVLNKPPVIYLNLCSSLLGVLLAVPDSPSKPPLYLFKAFLNAIQRYPWPTLCNEKGRLLIRCLCWLSASRQPDYPVRIGHVQSNDQVYGSSPAFLEEVDELSNVVLGLLIQMMDDEEARPRRPTVVCMELLEAIVAVGDVNDDDMAQLALNLYTICSNFSEFSRRTFTVITALKETGHPLFAGFPSRN